MANRDEHAEKMRRLREAALDRKGSHETEAARLGRCPDPSAHRLGDGKR